MTVNHTVWKSTDKNSRKIFKFYLLTIFLQRCVILLQTNKNKAKEGIQCWNKAAWIMGVVVFPVKQQQVSLPKMYLTCSPMRYCSKVLDFIPGSNFLLKVTETGNEIRWTIHRFVWVCWKHVNKLTKVFSYMIQR